MKTLPSELSTIRDWIRWGASQMQQQGLFSQTTFDSALSESQTLVLHSIGLYSNDLDETCTDYFSAALTQAEKKAIFKLLQERITSKKPLAYLTQHTWFAGLDFFVDERTLVPRSPIAELIEQQFSPWVEVNDTTRILDLCTGGGCIAIACAYAFPDAQVDAVDLSPKALEVAAINQTQHGVEDHVHFYEGDLFSPLPAQTHYDLIVSNPPYVDAQDMANLPAEIRHEPKLGLEAGENGLDIVDHILAQAADYLSPQGVLIVEVGNSEQALIEKYPSLPFLWLTFNHGGHGVFLLTKPQLGLLPR